jgi:hypothetical protein
MPLAYIDTVGGEAALMLFSIQESKLYKKKKGWYDLKLLQV